jgi:hypothetical protein
MDNANFLKPAPERVYPVAAWLCLVGVLGQMMISGGVLFALGMHYATFGSLEKSGGFYEKIHPGTYFIYLSLFVLLLNRGGPIRQTFGVYKENRIACFLLVCYIFMLVLMVGRSGPGGLAFILDSHMTAVICAIVLSYLPRSTCRKAINVFMIFAVFNSLVGIVEGIWHFRLVPYNEEWPVLVEETFRASAFEGHPLENAMFTSLAVFTALGMRYAAVTKAALVIIFFTSLVAFGGRAALAVSIISLIFWAIPHAVNAFRERRSLGRMLATAAAIVAMPVLLIGGLYGVLSSTLGERIAAHAHWDESADTRRHVLKPIEYMNDAELFFGLSPHRLESITERLDQTTGARGIENPWVLMFIQVGGIFLRLLDEHHRLKRRV